MDTIQRRNKLLKFIVFQKCLGFELWIAPKHSKHLGLTWKFSTTTRLQGEDNPTNFIENKYCMKEIQVPQVVAIKMQFGELKLNPWTSNAFQEISTTP